MKPNLTQILIISLRSAQNLVAEARPISTHNMCFRVVYNKAIVYKRQNVLKVVVHVIIIDQCNQTARLTKSR